jgi:hypothetical protein
LLYSSMVLLESDVRERRDRERDRDLRDRDRDRDRTVWEEEEERRIETERRGEQLKEAWRQHHPEREPEKGRAKKRGPS